MRMPGVVVIVDIITVGSVVRGSVRGASVLTVPAGHDHALAAVLHAKFLF